MILSAAEIKDIRTGMATSWTNILCDSHEELRKERDEALAKIRKLILEKATVRETKECEY
jgi:hypothetical protein